MACRAGWSGEKVAHLTLDYFTVPAALRDQFPVRQQATPILDALE
jgi:hypothetical protein